MINKCYKKLEIKDKKQLLKKFVHSSYYTEGVTKFQAIEYLMQCGDFNLDKDNQKLKPNVTKRGYKQVKLTKVEFKYCLIINEEIKKCLTN